jgi:hypothetical protein
MALQAIITAMLTSLGQINPVPQQQITAAVFLTVCAAIVSFNKWRL